VVREVFVVYGSLMFCCHLEDVLLAKYIVPKILISNNSCQLEITNPKNLLLHLSVRL
jgi:hypothetical protein